MSAVAPEFVLVKAEHWCFRQIGNMGGGGLNWVNKGGDVYWWLDWSLHWRKTSFPHGHRDLIPSQLWTCVIARHHPAPRQQDGVIQEGRGDSMGNGDGVCLEYIPVIVAGISLDRLTACVCVWIHFGRPRPVEAAIDLIFALHSGGKRACRGAAHTGPAGFLCAAAVVMSVLWYADALWLLVTDYSDSQPDSVTQRWLAPLYSTTSFLILEPDVWACNFTNPALLLLLILVLLFFLYLFFFFLN